MDESTHDIIHYALPQLRDRFDSQSKEVLVQEEMGFGTDEFQLFMPHRGDKKALVELSLRNATYYRLEKRKHEKIVNPERHTARILETIRKDFRLEALPRHIECFDNSNFHGTHAVSACVVFKDGKPSKKDYRHFNIKTVDGPDDFASMEEAVYRRYKRLKEEGEPLPQLIVIDGGKGQLSSAVNALEKLDLRGKIAIVGIAKKLEEIFFPGDSYPIYIDKKSESLKVIQHLRNEAHRFGITHHRNKRSKAALISELTQIKGIGDRTYELLIRYFKSVEGVKRASKEDLEEAVGKAKAAIVRRHFEQG
jgi:excinuclease ABC subunit C